MSSQPPKMDQCDIMANVDRYGLGPGVFPKAAAPKPPYILMCLCRLTDAVVIDPKRQPKELSGVERAYLRNLPAKDARDIAGSWEKRRRVLKDGEPLEDIYNEGKDPLYQWRRMGEVGQDGLIGNDEDFLEGRSRARGETPKHVKPTPVTLLSDRLSKAEGGAKAYVLGNGQKTGNEHMVAFDLQTGKRLAQGTSNEPGRVYIPDELTRLANDPSRKIAYHHNHPDGFSLSAGDLRVMAKRPGLYEFLARRRDVHDLEAMLDVAKVELRHQGQWAARRGLSLRGLEAHLTNLALQRAGLIEYEFVLDAARERLCQHEQVALNQIVAVLATRIQQMRAKP